MAGRGPSGKVLARGVLKRTFDMPGHPMAFMNPQIKVLIENEANYIWYFDDQIEPSWMQRYPPEQRYYFSTPGFYRWMGKLTKTSPLKIQHLVRSGLSYQLDEAVSVIDNIKREEVRVGEKAELPVFGRLFTREPAGWYTQSVERVEELDRRYEYAVDQYQALRAASDAKPDELERLRRQIDHLLPMHQAMLRIGRLYDRSKAARERHDFEQAEEYKREMVEAAAHSLSMSGMFNGGK